MKATRVTKLGVQIARNIVRGDVSTARALFNRAPRPVSWSVPEARAIAGACRYANNKWGAPVTLEQFL